MWISLPLSQKGSVLPPESFIWLASSPPTYRGNRLHSLQLRPLFRHNCILMDCRHASKNQTVERFSVSLIISVEENKVGYYACPSLILGGFITPISECKGTASALQPQEEIPHASQKADCWSDGAVVNAINVRRRRTTLALPPHCRGIGIMLEKKVAGVNGVLSGLRQSRKKSPTCIRPV